jgi:hypothetical protein
LRERICYPDLSSKNLSTDEKINFLDEVYPFLASLEKNPLMKYVVYIILTLKKARLGREGGITVLNWKQKQEDLQ